MSGLGARLAALTPEQLAELVLARKAALRKPAPVHAARTEAACGPLSYSQRSLWALWNLQPENPFYNIPAAVRLHGPLDARLLRAALEGVVRRHAVLRATFPPGNGEPVQVVAPPGPVPLPVVDAAEAQVPALAREEARRPFDLVQGPLLRARLLRLAPDDSVLLLSAHHIAADAWSLRLLVRELSELYAAASEGRPSSLNGLDIHYSDYVAWESGELRGKAVEAGMRFWREALSGRPGLLQLPADRARPPVESHRGARFRFPLPAALLDRVRQFSAAEKVTPFIALLTAFSALLDRYTGQGDILIGTPVANRRRKETEALIGLFVNTIVIRTRFDGLPSYRELVRRTWKFALDAFAHQDVPFELLATELEKQRDLSRNPLFQSAFALESDPIDGLALGGVQARIIDVDPGVAKFDLTLAVTDSANPQAVIEYSTDLFDESTIERMAGHFRVLLDAMLDAPDAPVLGLFLLSERERETVLNRWSAGPSAVVPGRTFHEDFALQAARTPDAAAVVWGGEVLTYAVLNTRANQLARHLRRFGVGPDVKVALLVERSVEMIVGILGILKAGGAWIPLDASYPRERLAYILEDSQARVMVTRGTPAFAATGVSIVSLEADRDAIGRESDADFESGAAACNLAYIIYTSGSTGKPKGAMIEHASLLNLAAALQGTMYSRQRPGPLRVSLNSALSFDASVQQLVRLLHGDALYIVPESARFEPRELMDFVAANRLDMLDTVPAQLRLLVESGLTARNRCRPAVIMTGGEALDENTWKAMAGCPDCELYNAYGPTECTVEATNCSARSGLARPAIGTPLANMRTYILDGNLHPVPAGLPGELHIGGAGVGRGYLDRPELTAERFIPDPFGGRPGARLYRTGDLARWLPDGNIEFLGRTDRQVKVRGFRIEPGEIEAALSRVQGVGQARVLARPDSHGESSLVAYVVPEDGSKTARRECLPRSLRDRLKRALPAYMVPATFVLLDALPLTPSGKLDDSALPAPEPGDVPGSDRCEPPRDALESRLAELWSALLGAGRIGVTDDFFELGGDSIRAAVFTNRVQRELGVEAPVKWVFQAPSIREYAALLRRERGAAVSDFERGAQPAAGCGLPPLRAVTRETEMPLSVAQQRLWVAEQVGGGPLYNIPAAVRLHGDLDVAALESSLDEIVRRHEALRTAFVSRDGRQFQVPLAEAPLSLDFTDLRRLEPQAREAEAERVTAAIARTPFDLERPPLLRARLLRVDEREHVLALAVHHLVFDGWSARVLIGEMSQLYAAFREGRPNPLPPLPIQYADWASQQREWLNPDALSTGLAYWEEALRGIEPLLLPADHARPAARTYRGAVEHFEVPAPVADALRALSRARGCTLLTTVLSAFAVLLSRYSGQTDFAVGTPVAGRTRAEAENLIGLFVNTLALRMDLSGGPSFLDCLERVRGTLADALGYQEIPFELVAERVAPARNPGYHPVFQVMFSLEAEPVDRQALAGIEMVLSPADSGTAKFDLTMDLKDAGSCLSGTLEYNTDLFAPGTAARMAGHFVALLGAAANCPESPVARLPFLTGPERDCIVGAWSRTVAEPVPHECFHTLFEEQARRTPERQALWYEGDGWSYRELNRRANRLAHYLRALGAGPEHRVALSVERSTGLIAALLAILKAGAAYVPIDPQYPRTRIETILCDSAPSLLLTEGRLQDAEEVVRGAGARVVRLDRVSDVLSEQPDSDPPPLAAPSNLAYIIYTSGSTGLPKGVMVEHRSVINLARALEREIFGRHGGAPLRVGLNASLAFDASVEELTALLSGHALYLIPDEVRLDTGELAAYIRRNRLDVFEGVPAQLRPLLSYGLLEGLGHKPRVLISGGDAIDENTWARLARAETTESYNTYGPTECTVDSAVCRLRGGPPQPSIGRPVANARLYVLDRHMELLPAGVPGELCVGGAGLARGYLGRPELTAERFLPDPFSGMPGARLYRTGDLTRWTPEGTLEYLGRADRQVKIRGFRIEPGEIEAALRDCPEIEDAVVVKFETRPGEPRLAAYAVPKERIAPHPGLIAAMRAAVKKALPSYMMPAAFAILDRIPVTANGKVDKASLPPPDCSRQDGDGKYAAPRTKEEEVLAGVWQAVLGVARVGIYDDFFELGGDSILAIQTVARSAQAGLRLTPGQLFQHPTIAELAPLAGSCAEAGSEPETATGPLPLTPIQQWFFAQPLPDPDHYNQSVLLEIPGGLDRDAAQAALNQVAARHDALRLRFARLDGGWEQTVVPAGEPVPLAWEDFSAIPPERRDRMAAEIFAAVQRGVSLSTGPVMRAAYLDFGPRLAGRLLLAVHHLAVDAVSWRILLEDLQQVYGQLAEGAAAQLPARTSSYRQWADAIERYARSTEPMAEVQYWRRVVEGPVSRLPQDFDGENTEASAGVIAISAEAFGFPPAEAPEFLLAALWRTLSCATSSKTVVVDLESHGREQIEDGLDLSRTVGWFTAMFPSRLEAEPSAWPAGALAAIDAGLHTAPRGGIGYGILNARFPEKFAGGAPRDVLFNYLGQLDRGVRSGAGWRPADESAGPERSPRNPRSHAIEIACWIAAGHLEMRWHYSAALHRRERIEALAEGFLQALRQLAAGPGCRPAGEAEPVGEEELAAFMDEIGDPELAA